MSDDPPLKRSRVFIYITYEGKLLVFDHVDFPELAIQIPGGTIEDGESPEEAARREAFEETGLGDLHVKTFLGDLEISANGKTELLHAWFYHLEAVEEPPTRWRHLETSPHGEKDPIEFELYWVPLNLPPPLGHLDRLKLEQLIDSLDLP